MNVVLIASREPQCSYLIDDGVVDKYGRPRCRWHCQSIRAHSDEHTLPPNNSGAILTRGEWYMPEYVLPHEV